MLTWMLESLNKELQLVGLTLLTEWIMLTSRRHMVFKFIILNCFVIMLFLQLYWMCYGLWSNKPTPYDLPDVDSF